jgi:hypothetical protein
MWFAKPPNSTDVGDYGVQAKYNYTNATGRHCIIVRNRLKFIYCG